MSLGVIAWAVKMTWRAEVDGAAIRIVNDALRERLYINDVVVDEHRGLSSAVVLRGNLAGAPRPRHVEVRIAGVLWTTCTCTLDGKKVRLIEQPPN